MHEFHPATRLSEVAVAFDAQPLEAGDPRYVNITAGRGSDQLNHLRRCLLEYDERDNRFAKIALTGHRGGGKSTELLRLEHELKDRFTSLHLYAEDNFRRDYDYTYLFLWLVEELVGKFVSEKMPLETKLVDAVANWFGEVSLHQEEWVKEQAALETEASAEGKTGLPWWLSLRIFARLTSILQGSVEHRKEIRLRLQNRSRELVNRVNLLLDDARRVLKEAGRPSNLLVVVDNLDRLEPEAIEPLFFRNGDFLKEPRAHVVYTVPIATVVAPNRISMVFEQNFTFPMVRVRTPGNKRFTRGIEVMVTLIQHRAEIDAVFQSRKVADELAKLSGGSVRDLMRLVQSASRVALAGSKSKIDKASVMQAARDLQQEFAHAHPRRCLLSPARASLPDEAGPVQHR